MGSITYAEAVNGALDRLQTTGFYIESNRANHGPMAAEGPASIGYCNEVDGWLDTNIQHRKYGPLPDSTDEPSPGTPVRPINDRARDDWRAALGDRDRGGD